MEDILVKWETTLGRDHINCQEAVFKLGSFYFAAKDYDKSFALLRESAEASESLPGLEVAKSSYRNALLIAKRADEFNEVAEKELAAAREKYQPHSTELTSALAKMAMDYLMVGSPQHAETIMRECLKIRQQATPDSWNTVYAKLMLGKSLVDQSKFDEAELYLVDGYSEFRERIDEVPERARMILRKESIEWLIQFGQSTKDDRLKEWEAEKSELQSDPMAPIANK